MAPHSSTLAWKIPWTEEPGRLQSMEGSSVRKEFQERDANVQWPGRKRHMAYGTTLVVQWLKHCASNARGPSLIPSQGTRTCLPKQRSRVLQLRFSTAGKKKKAHGIIWGK